MGVGAEVANAETEREREMEGGIGVSKGGGCTCCYPRWIHTTNEGERISHRKQKQEGVESQKGDGNTGMEKGLKIHKDTGWRSRVVAG